MARTQASRLFAARGCAAYSRLRLTQAERQTGRSKHEFGTQTRDEPMLGRGVQELMMLGAIGLIAVLPFWRLVQGHWPMTLPPMFSPPGVAAALILVAALFAGCAHTYESDVQPLLVQLPAMERSPLRIAILTDPAQRDRVHELSTTVAGGTQKVRARLARALQDTLLLSLRPWFERVTTLSSAPPAGAYHLVLEPKVLDANMSFPWSIGAANFNFKMRGVLRVLDQAGAELSRLETEEETTTNYPLQFGHAPIGLPSDYATSISRTIAKMVRTWSEQMHSTPAIRLYMEKHEREHR